MSSSLLCKEFLRIWKNLYYRSNEIFTHFLHMKYAKSLYIFLFLKLCVYFYCIFFFCNQIIYIYQLNVKYISIKASLYNISFLYLIMWFLIIRSEYIDYGKIQHIGLVFFSEVMSSILCDSLYDILLTCDGKHWLTHVCCRSL